MSDTTPDPDLFRKDDYATEFIAKFSVEGEISVTIKADTLAEAQAKARAMLDEDDFGTEIDDVHNVSLDRVRPHGPMFLVLRDGRPMRVSHLNAGDQPREPGERGF